MTQEVMDETANAVKTATLSGVQDGSQSKRLAVSEHKGLTAKLKRWFSCSEQYLIEDLNATSAVALRDDSCDTVIALDCMGGDQSPNAALEAVDIVTKSDLPVKFILCGREEQLQPLLAQLARKNPRILPRCTLRHCETVISGEEKPVVALRHGKDSSMRVAIDCAATGEADACISAGNTGALMAMSKVVMRSLPGIDRPAIISAIPTVQGRTTFLLDMGANLECSARNLCEFAIMGRAFAKVTCGVAEPTMGLLNLGTEEIKGNEEIKTAAQLLRQSELAEHFYGYVEGDDIAKGTVDVVATDGFTGNVALKAIEGTAKLITHVVKSAFLHSFMAKVGALFACGALKEVSRKADPRLYNGGMFLGLNGICVKSHGNSDKVSFTNAIKVTTLLCRGKINQAIQQELSKINLSTINASK